MLKIPIYYHVALFTLADQRDSGALTGEERPRGYESTWFRKKVTTVTARQTEKLRVVTRGAALCRHL
ncbi:MAG: hypothetical protein ABSF29_13570 [Tepidisphaeraceae bacterium]|jgi:hypothetical protein